MPHRIKKFSQELVSDAEKLIVSDPISVNIDDKVIVAVDAILKDPRTQTVYVIDKENRLKGLIGINDLLKVSAVQMGAYKRAKFLNIFKYMSMLYSETVEDIMRSPLSVKMNDKLIDALQIMEENNLTDLPVIDNKKVLIGEISGLEILTVLREIIKSGEGEKLH